MVKHRSSLCIAVISLHVVLKSFVFAVIPLRLNTPVIDFANVKLIVFVDPLGSSYNVTANFLAAIGGEYVTVHDTTSNNKTDLNSFLDKVWPIESSVELFKINGGSVTETGYGGSEGVVTRDYGAICGESCISAGGLPAIWLAQPAFQRYRKLHP